jgi:hypothetical protein
MLLFLKVDIDFRPDNRRVYNASEVYKFGFQKITRNKITRFISQATHLKIPKFLKDFLKKEISNPPSPLFNELRKEYTNEIKNLESYLNANLDKWYKNDNY